MALEVSAAIIGILAAAGKVAETLGPMVSAFVQAPKHAQHILTEIKHTETILLGLDALTKDLATFPRRRKDFIRVNQLVAVFTDGVLLFSELEALVSRLGKDLGGSTRSRTRWAKHKSELDACLSRLVSFKITMNLMLNILRCDSDVDAQRDRDQLLTMTSTLLANNLDLARRLTSLESGHQHRDSVATERPSSPESTVTVMHSGEQFGAVNKPQTSTPDFMAYNCLNRFESELEASRVYRNARRQSDDFTFRSSVARSHAWSALSDVSLSEISALSVIALPIYPSEITNAYHYVLLDVENESDDRYTEPTGVDWSLNDTENTYPTNINDAPSRRAQLPSRFRSRFSSGPVPTQQVWVRPSTNLKLVVIGVSEVDVFSLVAKFGRRWNGLSESSVVDEVTDFTDHKAIIDGFSVHLDLQVTAGCFNTPYSGLFDGQFRNGDLFMLVYNITSRSSFLNIYQYVHCIWRWKETEGFPIMIVGNRGHNISGREVSTIEGAALAKCMSCAFCEVAEDDPLSLQEAFYNLVREGWKFEHRQRARTVLEHRPHPPQLKVERETRKNDGQGPYLSIIQRSSSEETVRTTQHTSSDTSAVTIRSLEPSMIRKN